MSCLCLRFQTLREGAERSHDFFFHLGHIARGVWTNWTTEHKQCCRQPSKNLHMRHHVRANKRRDRCDLISANTRLNKIWTPARWHHPFVHEGAFWSLKMVLFIQDVICMLYSSLFPLHKLAWTAKYWKRQSLHFSFICMKGQGRESNSKDIPHPPPPPHPTPAWWKWVVV